MVNSWILVPVIAAVLGWLMNKIVISLLFRPSMPKKLLGFRLQGLLPGKQNQIAGQLGRIAATELLSFNEIAQNISRPENVQKVMPHVEEHIDHFLKVKLPEQMPVIGMFIGDKTIAQLKAVFTSELETIFPVVMDNYVQQLRGDLDLEHIIAEKLRSFPAERLEQMVRSAMAREIRVFEWIGAVLGFVIGSIAVLLTLFVQA